MSDKVCDEQWCEVDEYGYETEPETSQVVKNLQGFFDDNREEENYNNNFSEMNLKYSLIDKKSDTDESIFESYEYPECVVNYMKELQTNHPKVIWSTNVGINWLSWFKCNELGLDSGDPSKILSTDEISSLYKQDFKLHDLLCTKVECNWGYWRDMYKYFGLGYGGDPIPIMINGYKYENAPPPKKLIHSHFIDLVSGNSPEYKKVLDFDCYGIWLDKGYDVNHFKLYGIFNSDNGIVVRSLQLFVDPINIIGNIMFDIPYWEEYKLNEITDKNVNMKVNSFISLLKYMNTDYESFEPGEIVSPYFEEEENMFLKKTIVLVKWIDGMYYHAYVEHIDEYNNYYITYIGYNDTCMVNENELIFNLGNSDNIILQEEQVRVNQAKLDVRKAELQLNNEILKMKRIMYGLC